MAALPSVSEPVRDLRSVGMDSPVGPLWITACGQNIIRIGWRRAADSAPASTPLLDQAMRQLEAYFAGQRRSFELPLAPAGSAFQQQVHRAMLAIPYGRTATYGELAATINSAAQPVGNACGRNPIPIVIPCHRVLASKNLGGYSGQGGVETKIQLLRLEQAIPNLI